MKPIWNGTPASATTASARSTAPSSSEIGFSQKIALPARAAASISDAWVSVLVQIATASTSAAASTSSAVAATGTSSAAPTCCALPAWTSWTAVTLAPSTWRASSSACIRPMRPTPITPTRTGGAAVAVVVSISPP